MADPTFQNLSFETAGAGPGEAAGWAQTAAGLGEAIATFGPAPNLPWEGFEGGWAGGNEDDAFSFAAGGLLAAPFTIDDSPPTTVAWEPFEGRWHVGPGGGNENDVEVLTGAQPAIFYVPDGYAETFGEGPMDWENDYIYAFEPSDLVAAEFGAGDEPVESFESEWQCNEDDSTAFAPADLVAAMFGEGFGGSVSAEGFEAVYSEHTFSPKDNSPPPPTDTIVTDQPHGFAGGEVIRFRTLTGALPAPLRSNASYAVGAIVGPTECEVDDALGNPVDWGDGGDGENVVFRDPTWYWHTELDI